MQKRGIGGVQLLSLLGSVCAICVPTNSFAQTASNQTSSARAESGSSGIEEVVVTAERRASNVQKTAASITVRGGEELLQQGRYSLSQILEDVPGVTGGAAASSQVGQVLASGTDNVSAGITIRGIQSNTGAGSTNVSVAPATAIYVDGVYEGVGGGYDIDRVEILKGPQGTLYGRSATAGVVAIHTANPDLDSFGGNVTAEFGNFALQHYEGAINVPIIDDQLALRVSGNYYSRDGYYISKGWALANTDGKAKLLYQPNDKLSVLLGFALQHNTESVGGETISEVAKDKFTYTATPISPGRNDFRQYWAEVNWDAGPFTVTYEPAYRTWTSDSINSFRGFGLNTDTYNKTPKDTYHTEELRLASEPGSDLIWQMGAFYYYNDLSTLFYTEGLNADGTETLQSLTNMHQKATTALGLFAEATYPVAPSWRITGGIRYDYTKVSVDEDYTSLSGVTQNLSGDAGTRKFNNVTYKGRIEHDLSPENLLYASISSGFSPGDVSVTTGTTGNPLVVDLQAETLTAYEIGSKNRFLDDKLQINGAAYYYDYAGYQTADINISPNPTVLNFVTFNVPVHVYGAELEAQYQPTALDHISLSLAYTDAYYADKNAQISTSLGPITFGDYYAMHNVATVVPFTAYLAYDRTVPLWDDFAITLHGDARYMSGYDGGTITPAEAAGTLSNGASEVSLEKVSAHVIGDLNANWTSTNGKYSVTAYVRNVGNERYMTSITQVVAISQSASPNLSDPRTYGVILSAHF